MDHLPHYTRKARTMTRAALDYAIQDIQAALACWPDRDPSEPYVAKLLAEFDAYTVELSARALGRGRGIS